MKAGSPAFALATFYFWYFAFLGAYAPFWPLYLRSVGMSAAEIGTLLALVPVTRVFGPALWGWLADHRDRRTAIVRLTATVTMIVYAGVFLGVSFAWLFGVMLVMNLFWCGSLPLVEATTMAHLGERHSGYGRIRAWGSIGFVATVVGGGYLLDLAGTRSLLWLIALLLAFHAVSAYLVPEARPHAHHEDAHGLLGVLRRPEVLALFASCFLMSVAHGPYNTFYSIWLVDHGYSKAHVGLLWALGVVCEIGVFFAWSRLTARFEPRYLLLFAYAVAFVRFLVIGWLPDVHAVVVLAQAAHAATFGIFHGSAVGLVHRFFRGRHQSKGQALYSGIGFGAGGAAGGVLSGLLWERVGGQWTFTAGALAGLLAFGLAARWLRPGAPRDG
ncbi:MAG: MFS transporter [Betaproteobacteria bacterium]|nr:MFS transporter [Betaproteobacteria bacterium]